MQHLNQQKHGGLFMSERIYWCKMTEQDCERGILDHIQGTSAYSHFCTTSALTQHNELL